MRNALPGVFSFGKWCKPFQGSWPIPKGAINVLGNGDRNTGPEFIWNNEIKIWSTYLHVTLAFYFPSPLQKTKSLSVFSGYENILGYAIWKTKHLFVSEKNHRLVHACSSWEFLFVRFTVHSRPQFYNQVLSSSKFWAEINFEEATIWQQQTRWRYVFFFVVSAVLLINWDKVLLLWSFVAYEF